MNLLFLEPFFGGSHKQFAEGLIKHSCHDIELLTLPDCNWQWRIRGAALYFSKQINNIEGYDGIITTNLMRLSDFKAFAGEKCPPVMAYFHENQLTYPLAPKATRDAHLCMSDIASVLSADRVLFNSSFHKNAFSDAVTAFLERTPDYPPCWILDEIQGKMRVAYPGLDFQPGGDYSDADIVKNDPPLIIWNHRWSYDKNPASFFYAMGVMKTRGIDFKLALLGEHSGMIPEVFITAKERFKKEIVWYGYVDDKSTYIDWLKRGDIIVSTANQENFGLAVVEALRYGCLPLLPARLSYPEILPEAYHGDCLYGNQKQFIEKLSLFLKKTELYANKYSGLAKEIDKYAWDKRICLFDREISDMVQRQAG